MLKYQHRCYVVIFIMQEKDYNFVKNTVTKHGNGAKVLVPKEWIGKSVVIIPEEIYQEANIDDVMKGRRFRVLRGRRKG